MGVDCFKTDFGERIPVRDIAWHDGSDPIKMHNYYTYLYNRTVFELLKRERGEGDAIVFARSGTAGGQSLPVHWGEMCIRDRHGVLAANRRYAQLQLSCQRAQQ